MVTSVEEPAIAQHPVGQRQRRLVQDHHVHVVPVQDPGQAIDQAQTSAEITLRRHLVSQQHGKVDVTIGPRLPAGVRAKQKPQHYVRLAGQVVR